MHLYYLRADLSYVHEIREFREMSPIGHLLNADSYSEFIKIYVNENSKKKY